VGQAQNDEPPEHLEELRFWFARPDRMREERDADRGRATLAIQVGATWWSYSPEMGPMTNGGNENHVHGIGQELEAMLDPASVIGLLDFEITGRGERAGRPVILTRCRPRPPRRHDTFVLHQLGMGAEEYAIEVDAERGVLLRVEARFGQAPMLVREALEIGFDTPIDPELFVFRSPDGEEPSRTDHQRGFRPDVPLHEAVAAVPFGVWIVSEPPADWQLRVNLFAGSKRPPAHPAIHLGYRSQDAAAQVNINEMAAATAEDYSLSEGETVEHGGRTMRVRRRTDTWPQAQLSVQIGETLIAMNSDSLSADDLIELAGRLTRASSQPPLI
jgi:outer membrane lipoprotein-sorting protein